MMVQLSIRICLFTSVCLVYKFIEANEASSLDCGFETGFCNWRYENVTELKWTRVSYTSGNGYYIYISSWMNKGKKSRLISPSQSPGQYCLTFWYGMYGTDAVVLNVYTTLKSSETVIFSRNKDTGTSHLLKSVLNIKANESYQIELECVIRDDDEDDNYGIIAIDNISLKSGLCSIDCDFDNDFCNWMNYGDDEFDWKRHRRYTSTSFTGPTADHTSGHGYYIYIESSDKNRHDTAILLSPSLDPGKYCISYWYYMYGSDVDRLRLQTWHTNQSKQTWKKITSQQGQHWFHDMIIVSSLDLFKIAIEGRVKDAYVWSKGDIAIDDVYMLPCQDCSDPKPYHGFANSSNYGYGSVIELSCHDGYTLKGDSIIVCESKGRWNGRGDCIPHDCGYLSIPNGTFITLNGTTFDKVGKIECNTGFVLNGESSIRCTVYGWSKSSAYCELINCGSIAIPNGTFLAPNGTTFGQVGTQVCDTGFVLTGETSKKCTVNGWSSTSAFCKIIDCGSIAIPNGTFITPNGTTFGQVGRQQCDTGFVLNGEPDIKCAVNGWSNTSAYCKIIDCKNLAIQNGTFLAPYGTTFGLVGRQQCDTGFVLIGEPDIKCTVNGWANTSAYCKLIGTENLEPDSSPLVAVYILPPVAVVILAALITVVFLRRRHPNCIKIFRTANQSKNAPTETARNGKAHSNQIYNNDAIQLDDEYATIEQDQNTDNGLDTVYYAKVKKKITKKPDKTNAKGVTKAAEEIDQHNVNSYDVLGTEDLSSRKENDTTQDPDYDNACKRKMSSITFNHDDYSHLGDLDTEYQHPLQYGTQTIIQEDTNYSHIDRVNTKSILPKHSKRNNANVNEYQNSTVKDKKMTEERSPKFKTYRDEKAEYYNVDTDMKDTCGKSRFMIQETDQTCENDGFENHDYFILEKT